MPAVVESVLCLLQLSYWVRTISVPEVPERDK